MPGREPVATPAAEPAGGRLVDAGGRWLFLHCRGVGTPTVVFDAGYSADSSAWDAVAPAVAELTRACVWDRADTGRSANTPPARTSGDAVADLWALLRAAGEAPPYVLVGHSYGGQNVRLFAAEHPDDVAGLVLVDALHEDYFDRLQALDPAQAAALADFLAARPEVVDFAASADQLRAAADAPDVPAVVIVRDTLSFPPLEPTAETEALWRELQRDLAVRLPRAEMVVAEKSGHLISLDRPDVVVAAVARVIELARADAHR
jgi:pimeloyl-ACP methyl ester carboxylesterase